MQRRESITKNEISRLCVEVLEACSQVLKHLEEAGRGDGLLSGTEKEFAKIFESKVSDRGFTVETQVPLEPAVAWPSSKANMDARIKKARFGLWIGLEYKVVRLPRLKSQGSKGALYDIGQVTRDFIRIRKTKKANGGFCIILVYGPFGPRLADK